MLSFSRFSMLLPASVSQFAWLAMSLLASTAVAGRGAGRDLEFLVTYDSRDPPFTKHAVETLVVQRVAGIAL